MFLIGAHIANLPNVSINIIHFRISKTQRLISWRNFRCQFLRGPLTSSRMLLDTHHDHSCLHNIQCFCLGKGFLNVWFYIRLSFPLAILFMGSPNVSLIFSPHSVLVSPYVFPVHTRYLGLLRCYHVPACLIFSLMLWFVGSMINQLCLRALLGYTGWMYLPRNVKSLKVALWSVGSTYSSLFFFTKLTHSISFNNFGFSYFRF